MGGASENKGELKVLKKLSLTPLSFFSSNTSYQRDTRKQRPDFVIRAMCHK